MKFRTLALVSAATLSLAACGKTKDTTAADNAMAANSISVTEAPGVTNGTMPAITGGQAFANTAAASDAFEIETSKLAAANGASAAVRKYAAQMITAHTASTAKLKSVGATLSPAIVPDPALSADQAQKLADLKTKTGAAFDSAYAAAQVAGHQQTLDTLKGYAATGDVTELKTFASGLAPTVAAHLNMAKGLHS